MEFIHFGDHGPSASPAIPVVVVGAKSAYPALNTALL